MAMVILSKPEARAADPSEPVPKRLRAKLDDANLALEHIDSQVHVCNLALRHQDCKADVDVVVVLDAVHETIVEAQRRIAKTFDLIEEVGNV